MVLLIFALAFLLRKRKKILVVDACDFCQFCIGTMFIFVENNVMQDFFVEENSWKIKAVSHKQKRTRHFLTFRS